MAHVQRKCSECRRSVPVGARACPSCGAREASWVARYRGPSGAEHSRSFGRKVDAERYLHDQEAAKTRGDWIDPKLGMISFGDHYSAWRSKVTGLSPTTLAKYDRVWRLDVAPALAGTQIVRITRADVRAMVSKTETRSAWQAAEALKLTRHLLNVAMDEELIARNVAARLPLPETARQRITVLMPEQLASAADELPERFRALALLGGYSGLRWSELVAVRRDDIDLDARKVRVDERLTEVGGGGTWAWGLPKTSGSTRTVDLPGVVVKPLATHLLRFPPLHATGDPRLAGLVFYLASGSPVRRHVFRKEWRRACERAQVPAIRLEWLRHTGASLAYAASHDLKAVANRLGHTSTRMLDTTYLAVYDDAGRELADAIDDLINARLTRTES
jgi:integrase